MSIIPVTTSVPAPQASDNNPVVPCKAWFFFVRSYLKKIMKFFLEKVEMKTNGAPADLYFVKSQHWQLAVDIATKDLSTV